MDNTWADSADQAPIVQHNKYVSQWKISTTNCQHYVLTALEKCAFLWIELKEVFFQCYGC